MGRIETGARLGRYEVLGKLGSGGMGDVFRAYDTRLEREVALKLLRGLSDDAGARTRFRREALALSKISHPNIAVVFDFDTHEGIDFLAMELVEGDPLDRRLTSGPLPAADVVQLGLQLADGLAAAHDAGVVHRDLKPANLIVTPDGRLKILDFGVAQLAQSGDDLQATRTATVAGSVIGTLPYMSPEQVRGQAVDLRTDIYSAGAVLHELATGTRPFERESAAELIGAIQYEPPPSLAGTDPVFGRAFAAVIHKSLAKRPEDRYQSAGELRAAIETSLQPARTEGRYRRPRWILATAASLALVACAAAAWWLIWRQPVAATPDPVSVLITDVDNETGDPTFDRTLEPLMRLVLEGADFITAYDRTSMTRLGVPAPEVLDVATGRRIGIATGVPVVLSGQITRREDERYVISFAATHATTGERLVDAVQEADRRDAILDAAGELGLTLRAALGEGAWNTLQRFWSARRTVTPSTSLDAVTRWAKGVQEGADGDFEAARRSFSDAVRLDPEFGAAHLALGMTFRNLGLVREADASIAEALKRSDRASRGEMAYARGLAAMIAGDYDGCVKEYGFLAIRSPRDASAHNNVALCSTLLRDFATARQEIRRSIEILPTRALYRVNLALYAAYASDFKESEREARAALELGSPLGALPLAMTLSGQERYRDAEQMYRSLLSGDGRLRSFAISGLGDIAGVEGRFSDALALLTKGAATDLDEEAPDRSAAKRMAAAQIHLARGRPTEAVASVQSALEIAPSRKVRFLGGRISALAGNGALATSFAVELSTEAHPEAAAYARIVEANVALAAGQAREAIALLTEANRRFDTWIGHFDLGRAHLQAGAFREADTEFERCFERRGEALALLLDEEPSLSYLRPLNYYRGRAKEGLKDAGSVAYFRQYLAASPEPSDDPLASDARQRLSR